MKQSVIINDRLLKLLILLTVFNGFFTNFFNIGSIRAGTLVYDVYLIGVIFYIFSKNLIFRINKKVLSVYVSCFFMFLLVAVVAVMAFSTAYETFAGFRNHCLYISVFIMVVYLLNNQPPKKSFEFLLNCMICINIFAIFQALFHQVLPQELLVVKGATDFTIFGVAGYRCTGLVGDMLAMGSFATMTFVLLTVYLYYTKKPAKSYLWCFIPLGACMYTYSRASLGLCFSILVFFVFYYLVKKRNFKALLVLIASLVSVVILIMSPVGQTVMARFLAKKENAVSDDTRYASYRKALIAIREKPWFGLGFGTQMPSGRSGIKIITDGHLWECLLEMGIPLFVAMVIFYLTTFVMAFKNRKYKTCWLYSSVYIVMLSYFAVVSIFNSAIDSRTNMCVFMILLGYLVSSVSNRDKISSKFLFMRSYLPHN